MYSGLFSKTDSDTGYVIGWRDKHQFKAGKMEGEMTYGEARMKAEELNAKEPDKAFWPEKKLEFTTH
jgi:hypothetical protein